MPQTDTPPPSSPGPAPEPEADISRDIFLGGHVEVLQPRRGYHRSGSDAVFLAACLPPGTSGRIADFGAGTGAAGFCAAARLPDVRVTLVERDPLSLRLARAGLSLAANAAFAARVDIVAADITAREADRVAAGLVREVFDHVIMNPPYWRAGAVRAAIAAPRASARIDAEGGVDTWLRAANAALRPGGSIGVVFPADRLDDLLAGLAGRFGAVAVLPLHPRPGQAAHRLLVRAIKGSRAPLRLLPGLVLHPAGTGAAWTPEADAINRGLAALAAGWWDR